MVEYLPPYPWRPDSLTILSTNLRHVHRLTATSPDWPGTIDLEVVGGSITLDEEATPLVQGDLVVKIPDDVDVLDGLDPTRGARVRIAAGYLRPGNDEDVHPWLDLALRERIVTRPGGTMSLSLAGEEAAVLDWASTSASGMTFPGDAYAGDVIAALLEWAGVPPSRIDQRDTGNWVSFPFGPSLTVNRDDDIWTVIQDLCDQSGLWVRDYGDRVIVISEQPALVGSRWAGRFAVGADGSLTETESSYNRREWANLVLLTYEWGFPAQGRKTGFAEVTSGPWSTSAVGRKVRRVVQQRQSEPPWAASSVASSMVRRSVTRGRMYQLTAAHAAYWLRPGHRIGVQLVTGAEVDHYASRIVVDLPSGETRIRTRVPEDVTITTGE